MQHGTSWPPTVPPCSTVGFQCIALCHSAINLLQGKIAPTVDSKTMLQLLESVGPVKRWAAQPRFFVTILCLYSFLACFHGLSSLCCASRRHLPTPAATDRPRLALNCLLTCNALKPYVPWATYMPVWTRSWKRAEDPETKAPKGFGFCEYQDVEGVLRAIRLLDGLKVRFRVRQAIAWCFPLEDELLGCRGVHVECSLGCLASTPACLPTSTSLVLTIPYLLVSG